MRAQRIIQGLTRTEKVDCQGCGHVKELGVYCEDCGFPNIKIQIMTDDRPLIFLPLPPSTNARMRPVRMGRFARTILTDDARDYIASVSTELRSMARKIRIIPIATWKHIDLWVLLPRTNCDPTNYEKVLWDTLQKAGLVDNDRYILPHYQGVYHDAKDPQIIVKL